MHSSKKRWVIKELQLIEIQDFIWYQNFDVWNHTIFDILQILRWHPGKKGHVEVLTEIDVIAIHNLYNIVGVLAQSITIIAFLLCQQYSLVGKSTPIPFLEAMNSLIIGSLWWIYWFARIIYVKVKACEALKCYHCLQCDMAGYTTISLIFSVLGDGGLSGQVLSRVKIIGLQMWHLS